MESPAENSLATTAVQAIHQGNLALLEQLLNENPSLATARIDGQRTLLHVATDWPGHFPNSEATVAALIAHGANVNAAFLGQHSETPLTGPRAAMTSVCSMPYSITAHRSKLLAGLSAAAHHWRVQWLSGSGKPHVGWSSAARRQHSGRPPRWD